MVGPDSFDPYFLYAPHLAVDVKLGFHETRALRQSCVLKNDTIWKLVEGLDNRLPLPDELHGSRPTVVPAVGKNRDIEAIDQCGIVHPPSPIVRGPPAGFVTPPVLPGKAKVNLLGWIKLDGVRHALFAPQL